jgi:signal transduction histidine kinase
MALRAKRTQSLRVRVVLISMLWIAAALVGTGYVLNQLFEGHVRTQYQRQLQVYADYVLADIGQDARGQPQLERPPQNPRLLQPLSGLYWQLNDESGHPVLRSRSLWDQVLQAPRDALADKQTHFHEESGPADRPVLLLEQVVRFEWGASRQWRLLVAEDAGDLMASIAQWQRSLALFLSVLFVGLLLAVVAQAVFGFAPLRRLQTAITALRQGEVNRLQGSYPSEFAPLVDDFNGVLAANEKMIERTRAQAGDLAHAIKTPITIMTNATDQAQQADLEQGQLIDVVQKQLQALQTTVDGQLRRARLAAQATGHVTGVACRLSPIAPALQQLLTVIQKLYTDRELRFDVAMPDPDLQFPGESQDLVEILGNLLDNAAKWAKHRIRIQVLQQQNQLLLLVEDDGPGIASEKMTAATVRGTRLDEQVHGSGLGLAIVRDLVTSYGGSLRLSDSPLGGLCVSVQMAT